MIYTKIYLHHSCTFPTVLPTDLRLHPLWELWFLGLSFYDIMGNSGSEIHQNRTFEIKLAIHTLIFYYIIVQYTKYLCVCHEIVTVQRRVTKSSMYQMNGYSGSESRSHRKPFQNSRLLELKKCPKTIFGNHKLNVYLWLILLTSWKKSTDLYFLSTFRLKIVLINHNIISSVLTVKGSKLDLEAIHIVQHFAFA